MSDVTRSSQSSTAVSPLRRAVWLQTAARWALVLTVITLPWRRVLWRAPRPSPPVYADFTDLLLRPADLFLLLALLCWSGALLAERRRVCTGPFFLWWPLVALTLVAAVVAVTAVDPVLAATHAVRLLLLLLLYLYLANGRCIFSTVAWALGIQLVLQTAVGAAQVWRQQHVGLQWLGERDLNPMQDAFVWAGGGLRSLRAYGLSDHPNILAISMVLGILLLLAILLRNHATRHSPPATRPLTPDTRHLTLNTLSTIILIAATAVLFLTFFRPAWVILAISSGFVYWFLIRAGHHRVRRRLLWRVVLAIVVLLPLIWHYLPYLRLPPDAALIAARLEERQVQRAEWTALNVAANEIFSQNAVSGVGIGTLPLAIQSNDPDFTYTYQPVRVNVINVAAETGLFGALFYAVLMFAPWVALWWRSRTQGSVAISPLLIGLSGVLLAVTLFNFVDAYTWFYDNGRLWQWLIWGLWAAAYERTL